LTWFTCPLFTGSSGGATTARASGPSSFRAGVTFAGFPHAPIR
jgi:hypothetical protein